MILTILYLLLHSLVMEGDIGLACEWAWLAKHELPAKLEAIDKHIQECSTKLSLMSNGGGEFRPILLNAPHQGDSLLCTALVDGDKISKAEINVKAPGRGSKPLRTTIKEHSPWKLKQIQDSANHFQRVRDIYTSLQREEAPTQATLRSTLEQLSCALHQTQEALILPPATTAQQIFTSKQKSVLKPELPEDMAVHFHISSALLKLTVLSVTARAGSVKEGPIKDDSTSWLGVVFEQGSVVYEVTSQVKVQALVPWLQSVLTLLRQILELTEDLVDKVKVFDAVVVT